MTAKMQTLLQQDLKRFGLNPQEWILRKTQPSRTQIQVQIQHRRDPDFKLNGKIKIQKESAHWQEIELHSL